MLERCCGCFWIGWLFHLKNLTNSLFFVLISVLQPVIFASIAFFMFDDGRPGRRPPLRRARRGTDGDLVVDAVRLGRRDPVAALAGHARARVAAPASLPLLLLPLTIATATIGLYSIVATLFWGRVFFGVPLDFEHPCALRARAARHRRQPRPARARARLDVRPLPERERVLEPARVPDLARDRPARAALAPARLGRAALVGARADLGDGGGAQRGARRRGAGPGSRCASCSARVYLALGSFFMQNFERLARQQATLSLT